MKTYDVQIRRASTWKTDSTYDDRELAELRARQFEATSSSASVRVVEEVFVEKTQKYKRRTVYRDAQFRDDVQSKIDNSRTKSKRNKGARPSGAKDGSELTPGGRRVHGAKGPSNIIWIFTILAMIVALGIGAMMALDHLRNMN